MSTINNLKALISQKGGFAPANRFSIMMTPPAGTGGKPEDLTLLCESVIMPGRTVATLDYQNEKQQLKMPNALIEEPVSMTFMLLNDYFIRDMFDKWTLMIIDTEKYQVAYKENYTTDIIINQLDQTNKTIYSCKLLNAYPTIMSELQLNNTAENTTLKVTVSFVYDRFEKLET
ncbi:MAG TPA: hypothetical protein EYF95_08865 [Flavobacteriales bacterium]|nr:hypothetical protein [Flavobacteriales bacterium]